MEFLVQGFSPVGEPMEGRVPRLDRAQGQAQELMLKLMLCIGPGFQDFHSDVWLWGVVRSTTLKHKTPPRGSTL